MLSKKKKDGINVHKKIHYIARLAVDRYRYTWAYTRVQTHDYLRGYVTNLKDMGPDFS